MPLVVGNHVTWSSQPIATPEAYGAKKYSDGDSYTHFLDLVSKNTKRIVLSQDYWISDKITFQNLDGFIIDGVGLPKMKSKDNRKTIFEFVNCKNITLQNIEFDGEHTNVGTIDFNFNALISFKNCQRVFVQKCNIKNVNSNAIEFIDCTNVRVKKCTIENFNLHGIWVSKTTIVNISHNTIIGVGNVGIGTTKGGIGILCTRSSKIRIYKNNVSNTSDTGSKTEGCTDVEYMYNHFENLGKDGIKVQGYNVGGTFHAENAKIIGNTVKYIHYWRNDGSALIMVDSCDTAIVEQNICVGGLKTQGEEIGVKTFNITRRNRNVIVKNNSIKNCVTNGIALVEIDNSTIVSENIIENGGITTGATSGDIMFARNNITQRDAQFSILAYGFENIILEVNKTNKGFAVQPNANAKNIVVKNNIVDLLIGDMDCLSIVNYSNVQSNVRQVDVQGNVFNLPTSYSPSRIMRISCNYTKYDIARFNNNTINLNGVSGKTLLDFIADSVNTANKITNCSVKGSYPVIAESNGNVTTWF